MRCPFCSSPNVEEIGKGLYGCLDCGEQFSRNFYRPDFHRLSAGNFEFSTFLLNFAS